MKNVNKFRLGLFVIFGIITFFIGLFLFGLAEMFEPTIRCQTLFNESVQGLEVGSAVKFKGVPVGKVSHISIMPSNKTIKVDMEIKLSAIDFTNKKTISKLNPMEEVRKLLNKEINDGLRTRLEMAGITGMKYIECDYYISSKKSNKKNRNNEDEKYIFIPSTPSLFSDLKTSVSDVFVKISQIEPQIIAKDMREILQSIKTLLEKGKVNNILSDMSETSANLKESTSNIKEAFTKETMSKSINNFNASMSSITKLSEKLEEEIASIQVAQRSELAQEVMKEAIETLKKTSLSIENFEKSSQIATLSLNKNLDKMGVASDSFNKTTLKSKQELLLMLYKLENTLDLISSFISSLEKDPSSIIRGKHIKPIER